LRSNGLKLNGFTALLVLLGCAVAAALHKFFDVPLPMILGIFSGAVTNTPALGAGQQILTDLGSSATSVASMGMAYVWHLRHLAVDVADTAVFPHQRRSGSPGV